MAHGLTEAMAVDLARIVLGHVERPYPHKLDHVLTGPADLQSPQTLHPLFFGSLDWHSCVHGYWALARLLRAYPTSAPADDIRALFGRRLVREAVDGELAYLERPSSRGFERPYGWAWLLKLSAELGRHSDTRWVGALRPLAEAIVRRFAAFLPLATYPVRVGIHFNTAFALVMAADYAAAAGDEPFAGMLRATASGWYGEDRDCQAWEPGGDDFLSSALIEAVCMQRLLSRAAFRHWLLRFLPRLAEGEPATLFTPVTVSDRTDGKLAHLDGLNLSRAWCWRSLAASFSDDDPRRRSAEAAADAHLEAGLPHIAGDYMGSHWLASFALLALEDGAAAEG